jgi:hypothetical protein
VTEQDDLAPQGWYPEPTQEGWYRTRDSGTWLLYSLFRGQWGVHTLDGQGAQCVWGYIEQAGPVDLVVAFPPKED